jgi:hypothetical protein
MREAGPKGAVLVDCDSDGIATFEHRSLDVVRWETVELDAAGAESLDETCDRARAAVQEALDRAEGRLLALRVVIVGDCDAHHHLLADPERLRYEIMGAAAEISGDQIWIERVALQTRPTRPPTGRGSDAVGELLSELEELTSNEVALAELACELKPLADVLPASVRAVWDPTDPSQIRVALDELSASLPVALLQGGAD